MCESPPSRRQGREDRARWCQAVFSSVMYIFTHIGTYTNIQVCMHRTNFLSPGISACCFCWDAQFGCIPRTWNRVTFDSIAAPTLPNHLQQSSLGKLFLPVFPALAGAKLRAFAESLLGEYFSCLPFFLKGQTGTHNWPCSGACLQFSGDHEVPGIRFKSSYVKPALRLGKQSSGSFLTFLQPHFPSVITIRINRVPGGGVTHFLVMLTRTHVF